MQAGLMKGTVDKIAGKNHSLGDYLVKKGTI